MNWRKNEGYCMRKVTGIFFFLLLAIAEFSWGQSARLLRQRRLNRWDIPPANYSGIVPMGNGRYAVVSDKGKADGFYLWHVEQDSCTGKVLSVTAEGFRQAYSATSTQFPQRDSEGIAWNGTDGKLWISAEDDQQILAYFSDGYRTGERLPVPQSFSRKAIHPNYGFEALTYSSASDCFWAMTENRLRADGPAVGPDYGDTLRLPLLALTSDSAWIDAVYPVDPPKARHRGRAHVYGVVALTALDDGRLLVLERELHVSRRLLNTWAVHRIYCVQPSKRVTTGSSVLSKTPIATFRNRLARFNLANYEGMCPGIRLHDGRQTLLLINDSQAGMGNRLYRLKDYIRVVVLPEGF